MIFNITLPKVCRYIYEIICLGFIIFFVTFRILNPSYNYNYSIRHAAENGFAGIVKFLLKHKNVNPSDSYNWAIVDAYKNGHFDIVSLLWNDERVKVSLEVNNEELYKELIEKDRQKKLQNKVNLF